MTILETIVSIYIVYRFALVMIPVMEYADQAKEDYYAHHYTRDQ